MHAQQATDQPSSSGLMTELRDAVNAIAGGISVANSSNCKVTSKQLAAAYSTVQQAKTLLEAIAERLEAENQNDSAYDITSMLRDHGITIGMPGMETPSTVEPHQVTRAVFLQQARAIRLTNHGRRWDVVFNRYSAFSDAETAESALIDVHQASVNNALYLNLPEVISNLGTPPALPPVEVLAEYPEVVARFPELSLQSKSWIDALPWILHPHAVHKYTLMDAVNLATAYYRTFNLPMPASLAEVRDVVVRMQQSASPLWITGRLALDVLDAAIDGRDLTKDCRLV